MSCACTYVNEERCAPGPLRGSRGENETLREAVVTLGVALNIYASGNRSLPGERRGEGGQGGGAIRPGQAKRKRETRAREPEARNERP